MTEFNVGDEVVLISEKVRGIVTVTDVPKEYVGQKMVVTRVPHFEPDLIQLQSSDGDKWTVKPENVVLASRIKTKQDLKLYKAIAEL